MSFSRQSIALVTKQEQNNTQKHKITNPKINKLILANKTQNHTQKETKPKPAGPSLPVRTVHMNVHMDEYNCDTQYSTEQFW